MHKTIDKAYICCPFSNPCSGEDIFWDKFEIFYEKIFLGKFLLLHINDFLYAINEAYLSFIKTPCFVKNQSPFQNYNFLLTAFFKMRILFVPKMDLFLYYRRMNRLI